MLDIQSKHTKNNRRFQRIKVTLDARYLLADGTEHVGQTIDLSVNSIAIQGKGMPCVGTDIIVYIEQIGRIEGTVRRVTENFFALSFETTRAKRDRLAETLTWLANYHELNLTPERRHERFSASVTRSQLALRDGSVLICSIIDVSLSGAKIGLLAKPNIGENIVLGQIKGKVVRHVSEGVGIEFDNLVQKSDINRLLKPLKDREETPAQFNY